MVNLGGLDAFFELLDNEDSKILVGVMEGLTRLFNKGEANSIPPAMGHVFLHQFKLKGGFDKVKKLQDHDNYDVQTNSKRLIDGYSSKNATEN